MLWTEAELARERINARLVTEATLMQSVALSVMSPKEGHKAFIELTEKLNGWR